MNDKIPRRTFLGNIGAGFSGIALSAMLQRDGYGAPAEWRPPDGRPHFTPKAKNVILLFMRGGVSHIESFDPKPAINKYAGKTIGETPYKDVQDPEKLKSVRVVAVNANAYQRNELYPLQIGFKKYGQSGIEVSDWFRHVGDCVDDIAVIRSMWTTDNCHGAQMEFTQGRHMLDGRFPTIGAWVTYGLGTLNENVPQFITMGPRYFGVRDGHYLGPSYDAVLLKVDPNDPLPYAKPQLDLSRREQELEFGLIERLNRLTQSKYPDDDALRARIKSYQLAFRMQTSIPEVIRFADETEATKKLYGLDHATTKQFGSQLLATRRLVERGVRFIHINHGDGAAGAWDAHSDQKKNHEKLSAQVDKPIAGLLKDLKQRGMLDETIVVFATEFGRTPGAQDGNGRDHHTYGFSVWMAGGGIKGGIVHGATDELGFHAEEHPHYVTDIHATIMQLLGLDARHLELPGHKRLEMEYGKPIAEIIA